MTDNGGTVGRTQAPVMPPRRSRGERVQLNARVRVEVEQELQRFVREQDTTVQDCVDLALAEFLSLRGYPVLDSSRTGGLQPDTSEYSVADLAISQ